MLARSQWPSDGAVTAIVAEALAIAGLLWMLRIWDTGGRDAATAWAYRDLEPTTAADDVHDEPAPNQYPLNDPRSRGWLMARVELAIGVAAALVIPMLWLASPTFVGDPHREGPMLLSLLPFGAELVILLSLAWMVRIWRGPTRERPPAWRYRSR